MVILYKLKKVSATVPTVFYILNFPDAVLEVMTFYLGLIDATWVMHIQIK